MDERTLILSDYVAAIRVTDEGRWFTALLPGSTVTVLADPDATGLVIVRCDGADHIVLQRDVDVDGAPHAER